MRRTAALIAAPLLVLVVAAPALASEDAIVETSSVAVTRHPVRAEFERTITNTSESAIDIEPRDLRLAEYPTLTVIGITVGSFTEGIWTIGVLDAGQTATITYVGQAAAPEELPFTGPAKRLTTLTALGLALVVLGSLTLRSARS